MKRSTTWFSVLPTLVIPVCLGLVAYIGMMAAIEHQWITDPTVLRYLIGHPVSQISMGMFFVGAASLMMIGLDVLQQLRRVGSIGLGLESDEGASGSADTEDELDSEQDLSPAQLAKQFGQELLDCPSAWHDHYLFQRLASVLESIFRSGSASHVEEELKYLADSDVEQQHQRYSFVQILIWATPMLGFLGTVLGISQALGGITVGPDNNFQTMMDGLKASLYVAFDTTALALSLSMILMFGQFLIERFESQLLRMVTQRAHSEISSQFDIASSVEGRSQGDAWEARLLATMETACERQTEMWRESMRWVGTTLTDSVVNSQARFESRLENSIDYSIQGLAETVGESIERADHAMSHRWEQWQVMLSENARSVSNSQISFAEQTQAVCRLLEQAAQRSADSTQEITEQLREKTMQISEKLESVGQAFHSHRLAARVDQEPRSSSPGYAVAEGSWISVTPEYLCGSEDTEQVILPFPTRELPSQFVAPETEVAQGKTSPARREPEVVLPFLKKAA